MKTSFDKSFKRNNAIYQVLSPDHLDCLAKDHSFTKRIRKLSGAEFFYSLLHLVRIAPAESLSDICISLMHHFGKKISRQGIGLRFCKESVDFLEAVLHELLTKIRQEVPELQPLKRFFHEVRVMDSSRLCSNPSVKIQLEYCLWSGQVTYLLAEGANAQDLCHCERSLEQVEKGALYLRDKGYYKINAMRTIAENQAYFISRKHVETVFYINGKKCKLSDLVRRMIRKNVATMDVEVGLSESRLPVRLLIELVSLEQARQRVHQAVRSSKSHNNKTHIESYWACLANVLVTNASKEQLKLHDAMVLYKFREQIEMLFKALKSHLRIFSFKQVNEYRIQTMLKIKLIAICIGIHETLSHKARLWNDKHIEISEIKAFKLVGQHFWNKLVESLWNQKPNFSAELKQWFARYAIKEEPKGKRTIYETWFSSMKIYNFSGP